jgi:hypothetical protein
MAKLSKKSAAPVEFIMSSPSNFQHNVTLTLPSVCRVVSCVSCRVCRVSCRAVRTDSGVVYAGPCGQ